MHRRDALRAAGLACLGGLAGCGRIGGDCTAGETWQGAEVGLRGASAERGDDGWRFSAVAAFEFRFARDDRLGYESVDLRFYDADRELAASETIPGARWGSVPESNRRTDDCGHESGTVERSVATTVPRFPAWVDVDPAGGVAGHGGSERLRYAGSGPPQSTPATAYEPYRGGSPFPPIDDVATTPGDGIESITFDVGPCDDAAQNYANLRTFGGDPVTVELGWFYEVDDPCARPLLEDLTYDPSGPLLSARVGVHTVERAECPDTCSVREFTVRATVDGPAPTRGRIVTVDESGAVLDRATPGGV